MQFLYVKDISIELLTILKNQIKNLQIPPFPKNSAYHLIPSSRSVPRRPLTQGTDACCESLRCPERLRLRWQPPGRQTGRSGHTQLHLFSLTLGFASLPIQVHPASLMIPMLLSSFTDAHSFLKPLQGHAPHSLVQRDQEYNFSKRAFHNANSRETELKEHRLPVINEYKSSTAQGLGTCVFALPSSKLDPPLPPTWTSFQIQHDCQPMFFHPQWILTLCYDHLFSVGRGELNHSNVFFFFLRFF